MGTIELIPSISAVKASGPMSVAGSFAYYDFNRSDTLWLDTGRSSPSTADADVIAGVTDLSGAGNHLAQGTLGNRPLRKNAIQNGQGVLRFDNTDDVVICAALAGGDVAQPATYVLVASQGGGAHDSALLDSNTSGKRHIVYRRNASTKWALFAGTTEVTGTAVPDTSPHIFIAIFNGASSKLWVDGGSADIAADPGTDPLGSIRLGNRQQDTAAPMGGDFCMFAAYSGALSLADVNFLGGYGATRWALSWTTAV